MKTLLNKDKPKPTEFLALLVVILLLLIAKFSFGRESLRTANGLSINDSVLYLRSDILPYTTRMQELVIMAELTPYPELNLIIWYESTNNHEAQNPYSSAYGYCQIILSTRELIEKKIGKIDWQSPEEQLKACEWLYINHDPSMEWAETEYLWK